jgi:hypothetical protein
VTRAELFAELAVAALAVGAVAFQPSGVNPSLPDIRGLG